MHEGAWSSRLGIPGQPALAEEADGRPRPRARAPHRLRRCTSCTCRRPARSRWCRGAKAEGLPVTAEVDAAPLHASPTPRVAGLRPGVQGEPAAAHRRRRRRRARAVWPTGTIDAIATDHAPHTPEAKEEPFDQAPPGMLGLETALAVASAACAPSDAAAVGRRDAPLGLARIAVVAVRRADRRLASPAAERRPGRLGGRAAPTCASFDPAARVDRRSGAGWQPAAATRPYAGRTLHAAGSATPCSPASRSSMRRRGGAAMTADPSRRRSSSSPTAPSSRARPSARSTAGEATVGHRRARVQHRAVGLPGDHHRPVLRRAGDRLHLPPHRQLRGDPDRRRGRAALLPGRSSSATWPAGRATGGPRATSRTFLDRHGVGGITGVDTRRLTRHLREAGRDARARSARPATAELLAAAAGRAGHRRRRPRRARSRTERPYRVAGGPLPGRRLRLRHQERRSCANLARHRHASRSCPPATPAAEVLARRPDGVFLSNGPGDPAALGHLVEAIAGPARRGPDLRDLPRPPAPRLARSAATTYKLPFGHHGGNHPVRRLATGTVEITSQNHNYAVAPTARRAAPRSPT